MSSADLHPAAAVAQAERANPLYLAYMRGFDQLEPIFARPTLATAIKIGNPVSYARAVRTLQRFDGVVEQATEAELAEAAARADLTGMFNDPHTGVALAVLEKLAENGTIQPGQRTVVLSTANGLKFTDFKVKYHERALGEFGISSKYANGPSIPGRPGRETRRGRVFAYAGAANGQVTAFGGT
jgi:threonine synthase